MGAKPTTDHSLHLVTKAGGVPRPGPMNDTKAAMGVSRSSAYPAGVATAGGELPPGKVSGSRGGAGHSTAMMDGEGGEGSF